MTIRQFQALFAMARAHWFAIAVCCLLGALAAAGLNVVMPVTYEAKSRLFVATPNWNDSTGSGQPDDKGRVATYAFGDEFTQKRVLTYQELIDTDRVTSGVVDRLGLNTTPSELATRISARVVPDTVMIEVRATAGDPAEAAQVSDAAAEELSALIEQLETPFKQAQSPVLPVLIEPAEAPPNPHQPRMLLNMIAGLVLGLLLGLSYAAARERMKTADVPVDLAASSDTLGVLPAHGVAPFVALDDLGHEAAEDVRYACLRLLSEADDSSARTLLVASPRADDAVGAAAVLIAAGLAEAGHRVAVVMTNFADDSVHNSDHGLGDVLDGRATLNNVLRYDDAGRVGVISGGTSRTTSIVALADQRMDDVIRHLSGAFDYVLVIGAPVLESADAHLLAGKLSAAVLVCPVPPATAGEIAESERLLGMASPKVLGRLLVVEPAVAASSQRPNTTAIRTDANASS